MGDIKYIQQSDGIFTVNDVYNVLYRSVVSSVDDIIGKVIKMAEYKLAFFILTLLGIPAYIYAWFLDVSGTFELWKAIVLTATGGFTGLVIGLRQLVKLLSEYEDLKKKRKEFSK